MRIAIIGSGISGLTCAHILSSKHEVEVFEANDYIGGHTHTVDVSVLSGRYSIDTGFIVFNDWTYPNFINLMNKIGVTWQDSSMSFSVKAEQSGLEYNGNTLNTLFAQRVNLLRPSFHRMIKDILRFNKESIDVLSKGSSQTLGEYLSSNSYSSEFKINYIIPMGAAIWSSSAEQMDLFPVEYFVRFFKNHGMLSVDKRPVWRVIKNGSRSYIAPLIAPFKDKIRLNTKVIRVIRSDENVKITYQDHQGLNEGAFDRVIFASHSNQTLEMLKDASPLEKDLLGCFQYQANSTVLHTDQSVLPKRKLAWAAWNYLVPKEKRSRVAVTYNMNILQGISSPETFCVSLNLDQEIDPKKILRRFTYHHPVYSRESFQAQGRWHEVSGHQRTHYCGAYWGNGFHEDGVVSALKVCAQFSETLE